MQAAPGSWTDFRQRQLMEQRGKDAEFVLRNIQVLSIICQRSSP